MLDFQNNVIERLQRFATEEPEMVFQWSDKKSSARGYLVINSLKGGAAGGGTRVHNEVSLDEITTLAKIMEIKFTFSGPAIGGAKTGIKFDPNDPRKYEILERWYQYINPLLREYYGTGSDLNTDIHKINNILQKIGISNSQEGIINTVTGGDENKRSVALSNMKLLAQPIKLGSVSIKLAEMVTGFGVATTVASYYQARGEEVEGKRIYIQGAGNVGAAAAYYLHEQGAKIVALRDRDAGIIAHCGLTREQLIQILSHRRIQGVLDKALTPEEFHHQLVKTPLDVFIPAAGSHIVTRDYMDQLIANGLKVVACGANHPFVEKEYCYGQCERYLDQKITVLPDFLSNLGMARTFYILMSSPSDKVSVNYIFNDIAHTIEKAITQAYREHGGRLIAASLYHASLSQIA